ncbi:MAG: hypothetical protein ACREQV_14915 [Candidatus Binatia bacterium]
MRETQFDKGPVITVLMEYLDLRVSSIDDVITNTAYRSSARAWHTAVYFCPCSLGKRKVECPLYSPQHVFSRAIQFGGSSLGVKREEMVSVLVGALLKCSY